MVTMADKHADAYGRKNVGDCSVNCTRQVSMTDIHNRQHAYRTISNLQQGLQGLASSVLVECERILKDLHTMRQAQQQREHDGAKTGASV